MSGQIKKYDLDTSQTTFLEKAFISTPMGDGVPQKLEKINERFQQISRQMMEMTPKCEEQTLAIRKIQEAQMWFTAAIKKHEY